MGVPKLRIYNCGGGVPKLGICNCGGGAEMAPQKPWGAERFFSGAVGAREKILTNKTDMYGRVLI